MKIPFLPLSVTDWSSVEQSEHAGEPGTATWRTQTFGDIRIRIVEYTAGYVADHWCSKGHVVLCLSGSSTSNYAMALACVSIKESRTTWATAIHHTALLRPKERSCSSWISGDVCVVGALRSRGQRSFMQQAITLRFCVANP
jgi:hypothetical protein